MDRQSCSCSKPTVISTFAGCGGSSLGYHLAGYQELLAVEWDNEAVDSFRDNFPGIPVYHGDITELTAEHCMELAGVKRGELDVLDGSPPCQGFSGAGKRQISDPRSSLFRDFARLIEGLQPKVFVMENVYAMTTGRMKSVYLEIVKTLRSCGYQVRGEIMDAAYYNVAQHRRRVIIIGVRNDLGIQPSHPKPQSRPMTVREAWTPEPAPIFTQKVTPLQVKRFFETRRGARHDVRFSFLRLAWDRPAFTIVKIPGSGGMFHPDEPRLCTTGELMRLSSFPDTFKFRSWMQAVNRIGNSVPPNLMRAIAAHIKTEILEKVGK